MWVNKSARIIFVFCFFFSTFFFLKSQVLLAQDASLLALQETRRNIANQNTVTIVSGGTSGAQIRFTTDIADILNSGDDNEQYLRVLPIISSGGSQNVLDILYLRGIDMGIIHSDTLAYLRGTDPILYKNIYDRIHFVTKLYNAEWHVLAHKNINSLWELEGKRVNISRKLSGTYIASKTILELLGINVEYTTYSDHVALEKLNSGEISAIAVLEGAPAGVIQNIARNNDFHLVPVTFFFEDTFKVPFKHVLEHFYLPTKLTHKDYPNLIPPGKNVATVSSGVMLAVYNWKKDTERYRKVSRFVETFFRNFKKFKEPGRHPKWRDVNLAAKIWRWKRFSAAEQGLVAHANVRPISDKGNPYSFEKFQAYINAIGGPTSAEQSVTPMTPEQKKLLYQDFLKWSQGHNVHQQ